MTALLNETLKPEHFVSAGEATLESFTNLGKQLDGVTVGQIVDTVHREGIPELLAAIGAYYASDGLEIENLHAHLWACYSLIAGFRERVDA